MFVFVVCAAVVWGASGKSAEAAREITETRSEIRVNAVRIESHDKQLAELKAINEEIRKSAEAMRLDVREIKTILKRQNSKGEQ